MHGHFQRLFEALKESQKKYDPVKEADCKEKIKKYTAEVPLSRLNQCTSRMVDTFIYDYPKLVRDNDTRFAEVTSDGKDIKVAIIGSGFAGATAAYELHRAGITDITMYESREEEIEIEVKGKKPIKKKQVKIGGRAESRKFTDKDQNDNERSYYNEMGPMRVPENSKLFWHYLSKVVNKKKDDKNPLQKIFPNPGVVPSQIIYRGVSYTWAEDDPITPEKKQANKNPEQVVDWQVLQRGIGAFFGSLNHNGDTIGSIGELLQEKELDFQQQIRVHKYWSYFLDKYDGTPFLSAIKDFFEDEANQTFFEDYEKAFGHSLKWNTTQYNMFSTLGVGTGGFGPLFPVSFLELFRLLLWQYSNEYSPYIPMTIMVKRLLEKAGLLKIITKKAGKKEIETDEIEIIGNKIIPETVDYVGVDKDNNNKINVHSIVPDPEQKNGKKKKEIRCEKYDYVIVATPLRSMQISMNLDAQFPPADYKGKGSKPVFGNPKYNMVRESLRVPHIMNSSKLFGFLEKKPWLNNPDWPTYKGEPVKCVLTDTLARQMYFLDPYPNDDDAGCNVLISYNWGDDSVQVMGILDYHKNQLPERGFTPDFALKLEYQTALETALFNKTVANSLEQIPLHKNIDEQKKWLQSVVWQKEPMIFGAFKIDYPNQYLYTSQMVYQYQYNDKRYNKGTSERVFLAGNNCSYQGGWIEGAMQSAVNASSSVLRHMEEKGQAKDFRMVGLFVPNPFETVRHQKGEKSGTFD